MKPTCSHCGHALAGLGLLLACLWPAGRAWGYAELRIYKPAGAQLGTNEYAFDTANSSGVELVPKVSTGIATASVENGGLFVFASSFVGGASSVAWQEVWFSVPEPVHVYATITMSYTGDAFTYGFASWAGTSWRWLVNSPGVSGSWHDHDIAAAFTVETVGGKVIDLALELIGLPPVVEEIVELIQDVWDVYELSQHMTALEAGGNAVRVEQTVHFTVPEGSHVFAVGIKATASAFLTGFGSAVLQAQVQEIRLGLNSQEGLFPDLVISGVVVENEDELRTHGPVKLTVERANIGNADTDLETYELVALPTNGGPAVMIRDRGRSGYRGYAAIPAYTTRSESFLHTFTTKGKFTLLGREDPDELVPELEELNNQHQKAIRVRGTPPNAPVEPNPGCTLQLQRNQPFTLSTWPGTDPDSDPLFYRFEMDAQDGRGWSALTNAFNPGSNGWSATPRLTITPVLPDADLLPPPSLGLDARSFVTLTTNAYRLRAQVADEDGFSPCSAPKGITLVLNTLPGQPTLTGNLFSDTVQGVALTARATDAEGDAMAFRFNWADTFAPAWTEWLWCEPGTNAVTVSHLYASPGKYCIAVEATDLYATRYTTPAKTSPSATHCVDISAYWAPSNSLTVVSADKGRGARLPNAPFSVTGGTNLAATTGPAGFWQTAALPGTYTITFSNVPGYTTPAVQSQTLLPHGTVEFKGEYTHETGGIQVFCNIAGKGSISGQGTAQGNDHSFAGLSWSVANAWTGPRVIEYAPVEPAVYGRPVPPRDTNSLMAGGSITFHGRYIKRPLAHLTFRYPTNAYQPSNAFALVNEDTIELDASGSFSPAQPTGNGAFPPLTLAVERYRFDFDEARAYEEGDAEGAADGTLDGKTPHTFRRSGRRVVTATVFDSVGCPSLGTNVEVWVKERPVAAMTLEPSPAIAGEAITFAGSGTDADGDTIIAYEWTSSLAGLLSTKQTFAVSNLAPGRHEISLRAQGSDLVWSQPAREFLEVVPPLDWPAFKRNPTRPANQPAYAGRGFGQLPYGVAAGWPFLADSPIEGSPVAANLDGDWINGLEVVFVSRLGTLYVTDNGGLLRWSAPVGASSSTPAIGDLNGDGQPDLVVGSQTGVRAFTAQGSSVFTYVAGATFESAMPIIADVDPRSPGAEVAVTADDGSVHLIYRGGTAGTNQWPFVYGGSPGPPSGQMFAPAPAVAELSAADAGREVVGGEPTACSTSSVPAARISPRTPCPAGRLFAPRPPSPTCARRCPDRRSSSAPTPGCCIA